MARAAVAADVSGVDTKKAKLMCLAFGWDTRTRTKNDRTRICSVTITPYPIVVTTIILIASAKVAIFSVPTKQIARFFIKKIKLVV